MIITPHYRQDTLRIFRQSDLQTILANYRDVITITRSAMSKIGYYNDIRPSKPKWNGVVEHMRELCQLPDIAMPCTAYRELWWMTAHRKYLHQLLRPGLY